MIATVKGKLTFLWYDSIKIIDSYVKNLPIQIKAKR